jgi:DNA topoisomerase II
VAAAPKPTKVRSEHAPVTHHASDPWAELAQAAAAPKKMTAAAAAPKPTTAVLSEPAANTQPPAASMGAGDDRPIEQIYQKKTQLEHILLRPDTYIGSVEEIAQPLWVFENDKVRRGAPGSRPLPH